MSNIVQQICEQFTNYVVGFFALGSIKNIEEMETILKKKSYSFTLAMMAVDITSLDQAIVEDKAGRREKGLVIERRDDKRKLYTAFGQLKFTRTYFKDKLDYNYAYLRA